MTGGSSHGPPEDLSADGEQAGREPGPHSLGFRAGGVFAQPILVFGFRVLGSRVWGLGFGV